MSKADDIIKILDETIDILKKGETQEFALNYALSKIDAAKKRGRFDYDVKGVELVGLQKSELQKDGGTAANPTSRIDAGYGRVIIKNDEKREDRGQSLLGITTRNLKQSKDMGLRNSSHLKEIAKKILHTMRKENQQINPDLPKSELEKAKVDEGKSPEYKAIVRADRNVRHIAFDRKNPNPARPIHRDARFNLTSGAIPGDKEMKVVGRRKGKHQQEGVHNSAVTDLTGEKWNSGLSTVGYHTIAAARSSNPDFISSQKGIAKIKHEELLNKLRSMKKPDLPKSELEKADPKTKLPGSLLDKSDAKSKLKDYLMSKCDGMSKCGLEKAKLDQFADAKSAIKQGKEFSLPQVKGVQMASTARPKGVSDMGAMVRNPMKQQYGNMKINAAKQAPIKAIAEAKKPNLPKSELEKARIDEKFNSKDKGYERWKRGRQREENIHIPAFRSNPGMSNSGYLNAIGAKDISRNLHRRILEGMKSASKPDLPKSELEKARVDEDKNLMDKIRDRQARNDRSVIETRTSTGQKTRTARSHRRRTKELEVGTKQIYDKFDDQGRPMRVRGIPDERRKGEKISGTPRTIENAHGRDAESEFGVRMHSGSLASRKHPVNAYAPVTARGDVKSYVIGDQNKFHAQRTHDDIINRLRSMSPKLPKSELQKDGGTAANPTSRIDAGYGRVIIKNDEHEKGIHKEISSAVRHGRSLLGVKNSNLKTSKQVGAHNFSRQAKEDAKRIINNTRDEMAEIKPNLPKSEDSAKIKRK